MILRKENNIMNTFSEVFKTIISYPWQVNVGMLSIIPLYIIDFKVLDKVNIGLQRKKVHRGLYKTANGKVFNADINGALNIIRKSSVVDMNILYSRGEVDTPIRIRIA